ncbi:MAG: tripartite tricarboxylate transporter TctB family protein [Desulfofustis sp.]
MVKKDFITSIVLIAFSLSVVVMSYTMPRLEHRNIDPFSAPGVVPGMIGMILLGLSLILFFRSIRRGGYLLFGATDGVDISAQKGGKIRVLLTLALSLIYAVGLLGRINYGLATFIYIAACILIFEYRSDIGLMVQKKMIAVALFEAVIAALSISLIFRKLFLVDLP